MPDAVRRALDNRSPQPILGDATADQIVRTLDYDYGRCISTPTSCSTSPSGPRSWTRWPRRSWPATRTRSGSTWAPGSTPARRLDPPSTVDWYDVDFPAVAAARERLIPERPNAHVIGADVREPDWLDAVPSDRPAMIVADGLMGFLTQDEMVSLWNRLISHFPSGEIVFNSYTRFAIWVAQHAPGTKSVAELVKFPGMNDPHEPEAGTPSCNWSRKSCSAGNPRSPSSHRSGAGTTGWPRTAPPGPGREPSSCTTASEALAAADTARGARRRTAGRAAQR